MVTTVVFRPVPRASLLTSVLDEVSVPPTFTPEAVIPGCSQPVVEQKTTSVVLPSIFDIVSSGHTSIPPTGRRPTPETGRIISTDVRYGLRETPLLDGKPQSTKPDVPIIPPLPAVRPEVRRLRRPYGPGTRRGLGLRRPHPETC